MFLLSAVEARDQLVPAGTIRSNEVEPIGGVLGLGVPSDFPTWGRLLYDGANFMTLTPARVIWPGLAISLTVLSINFIGDGLRDALDPRIRGR